MSKIAEFIIGIALVFLQIGAFLLILSNEITIYEFYILIFLFLIGLSILAKEND